jgi:hypothetical protein
VNFISMYYLKENIGLKVQKNATGCKSCLEIQSLIKIPLHNDFRKGHYATVQRYLQIFYRGFNNRYVTFKFRQKQNILQHIPIFYFARIKVYSAYNQTLP